ncbi:MAG: DUF4402 domain-containing protein [Marinomonas sp.]
MTGQLFFCRAQKGALWAAAAIAAGALTPAAHAQEAVPAQTEVRPALELNKTADMDFGSLVVPGRGRVNLTPRANATCTPNNAILHIGACQAAAFEGRAAFGQNITVTVPNRRRFVITGPGQNLRIRAVRVGGLTGLRRQGRSANVYSYRVNAADGNFAFHIGARVLLRDNQAPGIYDGTFTISLDYQ